MRILLTGAGGQLGQALQATLTQHEVVALDHRCLDISQLTAVRHAVQAHQPEVVLNAAAFNNVDGAESDPDAAYRGNALGPRNLAVVTAAHHLPLLHVSTDYVFDGTSTRPYHEFDRPSPRSIYGASKLAGEEVVRALNPSHYIVRTAWLYHTLGRNFPKTMCALAPQAEVRVVSDQYGSPTYAPHLATAIAQLIPTGAYGTYHFAGRGGTNWCELTRMLYRFLGIQTPVRAVATADFPRPAERPRYSGLTTIQDPPIFLPAWEEGL
ncbi:MAG: dTDP-4-dehydrorhamnose reductase, partial [Deltaproteobacteria bacterium]|nr:dTDP-4-dehydrorhamnose reductase [Deltaproteobacteria bacterium]